MKEVITIYLGSKCNLNCPYCHRESSKNEPVVSEQFLLSLKNRKCKIIFKGGEPTLYINEVKQIVEAANMAEFEVMTNGILLRKYAEYFNKNGFTVTISYDGENSNRGFDPLNNAQDCDRVKISCTLSHNNICIDDIIKTLFSKGLSIGRIFPFFHHTVHYTNERNKDTALTRKDYDSILIQYKTLMAEYLNDIKLYDIVNMKYKTLYLGLKAKLDRDYIFGETMCVNKNEKRIDISGQEYNCLYIRDTKLSDNWLQKQQEIIRSTRPKCEKCKVYSMCGGGCLKSLNFEEECRFNYSLFSWFKDFYQENKYFLDQTERISDVSKQG